LSKAQICALANSIQLTLPRELRDKIYAAYFEGCDCDETLSQLGMDRMSLSTIMQDRTETKRRGKPDRPFMLDPWTTNPGRSQIDMVVANQWAEKEYLRPAEYPVIMFNPRFVGEQIAREAVQVFWESCTFTFVGRSHPRRPGFEPFEGRERPSTQIMDLWLDIDIARLGVLSRQHIRSLTIEIAYVSDPSELGIPSECLFGPPLQHLRVTQTLQSHKRSMAFNVRWALEHLQKLASVHRKLAAVGIVLVPATRVETYEKGESGGGGVLGVEDEEGTLSDDEEYNDSHGNAIEKITQTTIKTVVVDFDGCFELSETNWEAWITDRLTAVQMAVADK
jgi:hypothetical protein